MRVDERYDVTVVLDYYAPYVSGLTEAARVIAEGLAARGWRVAVVCSRHERQLPRYEEMNGVHVHRAPIMARVRKGIVSPALPWLAARLAARSQLLHLHLPMPEAAVVTRLSRRVPIVSTYHIDAFLVPNAVNRMGMRFADDSAAVALRRSDLVVVNSDDQARGSRLWPVLRERRLVPISSPCLDRNGGQPTFRDGAGMHVGFMGRIVEEKGIEYLIRAFRKIADPQARLLIAGDYTAVAGGSNIAALRAEVGQDRRVRFLGLLRDTQVNDFYASIDVFALPSIAESFGIVQAEAMMTGVPSVTTDLPGGRYPVLATGFGRVVPPRDPTSLRDAVVELAEISPAERELGKKKALDLFGVDMCVNSYDEALRSVAFQRSRPDVTR